MKSKTVILTIVLFVLIAVGMVIYTHLKSGELSQRSFMSTDMFVISSTV